MTFPGLIEQLGETFADREALIGEHDFVTYAELRRRCRHFAHWTRAQGLAEGAVVCLLMRNSPDYAATWLGISGTGAIAGLLNTNLRGQALAHAIRVAGPAHLIADPDLAEGVDEIRASLPEACRFWIAGPSGAGRAGWDVLGRHAGPGAAHAPASPGPASNRQTALLVYTSGTTGLPKAARISHYRVLEWSLWFAGLIDARADDRLYDCLPMYHSTGGIVAIGAMLVRGGAVVLRERFSATRFWTDVAELGSTLFLYIGELCRYLLAAPQEGPAPDHHLRLCMGNGLRGDIWERFAQRFRVPRILEFYASTEGNVSLYNVEGRPGAIGRFPPILAQRFPVALIRCDPDDGTPLRGPDGRCLRCLPGEAGEAIGKIAKSQGDPGAFEGYTDGAATEAKVLRDVFAAGDAWYRTGDLMRQDAGGFFFFVDRLGDTFRWKGENVSTTQVGEVICACTGVREAVVYGVAVPGTDGRAGMAAITIGPGFSLTALHAHLAASLPDYARPLFLRICAALETTGTFKPLKARLAREGWDRRVVSDPLYVASAEAGGFVTLDEHIDTILRQGKGRV